MPEYFSNGMTGKSLLPWFEHVFYERGTRLANFYVRGVSLSLRRGEAVGLLGPNGAGKTTVFYMITGLIKADAGRIQFDGHDITHLPMYQRARLGIVSALAANERLSFVELKSLLGATDGNISAHARKLEDAGYITARKRFEGRVPRTEYELTSAGRKALERYLEHMEALIQAARGR